MAKDRITTGIDLGTRAVKLVSVRGGGETGRVTHGGALDLAPGDAAGPDLRRAQGEALVRLLDQLRLNRRALGYVVAGVSGSHVSVAQAELPALSERQLRLALPFESRKHLFLDAMTDPVLDCQILSRSNGDNPGIRVLFVAANREERDGVLEVLKRAGIDPEVVDALPLAYLNALAAHAPASPKGALAMLDLGSRRAGFYVCHAEGALVCRELPAAVPDDDAEIDSYVAGLARLVNETVVFFRGRHRQEIDRVHLAGGGALRPAIVERLQQALTLRVHVFDPVSQRLSSGREGARLVGAYGLCQAGGARV